MAHVHIIVDHDKHFIIDPITKKIQPENPEKNKLVRYDHNSERYTFEMDRMLEGHDMSLCDIVQIHYINVSSNKQKKNEDIYEVNDLGLLSGNEDRIAFTWLVSRNATMLDGILTFAIRFACSNGDSIDYELHTEIFSSISISNTIINNGQSIVEEYSDILNQWKKELFGIEGTIQTAKRESLAAINQNRNESLSAIKSDVKQALERIDALHTNSMSEITNNKTESIKAIELAKTNSLEAIDRYGLVQVSEDEPSNPNIDVYIRPLLTETFTIPEIMDLTISPDDTWSSEKINAELNKVNDDVAVLKEDLDIVDSNLKKVFNDAYKHTQEPWYDGNPIEQYKTSTFSGFATNWEITEDKYVNAIYFKVRTRETNITEIRVRIESGGFSFEKSISVNIGTEMTEVCFPMNCLVPKGTVWIGIAANKICTYMHASTSTLYSYTYWTDGDMDNLSNLKQTGSSTRKLYIRADTGSLSLMNENTYDKTGKKEDIFDYAEKCGNSFENKYVKYKTSSNIFDKDTMSVDEVWYYFTDDNETGEGKEVSIRKNEYTHNYSAISIPVSSSCEITLSSNNPYTILYGYFCVNNDNITNSAWKTNVNASITDGYTISVPSETDKVLISIRGYWEKKEQHPLMINLGATKLSYEAYYNQTYLDGIISDPKVNTKVEKLNEYIGIDSPDKVCLKLPDHYDLVVGDTFELFYKGIINSAHPELYDVIVDCAKGSAYAKRFVITPTLAENLTLTVTLHGVNHTIVDRKSVILRVNEKAKSPISKTNILCIGDSLTTGGTWVSELHRRITGTGGNPNADNLSNINFIGSRQINGVGYEGYGGWTFNGYNTENTNSNTRIITCTHSKNSNDQHSVYRDTTGDTWKLETIEETTIRIIAVSGEGRNFPDSGTLKWVSGGINHDDIVYTSQVKAPGNPFWDTAKNKVDFVGYASKNGVTDIHYVYVLLGWNSASDSEEKYKNDVRTFINNVLSAFPNCKIVLMGLQLPARDGLGANYGATGIYSRYFDLMSYVWNLDKWYKDISLEFPNKVTTINIAGQFDTENNMPESTRTVNVRNSKEETYQTNGVHPATTGYYQIADAAYRDLTNKLQSS